MLSQQDSSGSQAVGSTLASTGFTLDGGSGTYSAAKTGALTWTVTAYGTAPSGDVTRHLEVQVAGTQSSRNARVTRLRLGILHGEPDRGLHGRLREQHRELGLITVPIYTATCA